MRASGSLQRTLVALGATVAVAASLLTFPGGVPWMVLIWLAGGAAVAAAGRRWWPMLAVPLAAMAVKWGDWPAEKIGFAAVLAAGVALGVWRRNPGRGPATVFGLVLTGAWAALLAGDHATENTSRRPALDLARPVACLGDSLTAGGWPRVLGRLVSVPVRDFAAEGINTEQALDRWPDMMAARPQAVVLELGGHDYLQGRPRHVVEANLRRMIEDSLAAGATVVLIEIPRGLVVDPFRGLERSLARRYDLQLVPDSAIRHLFLFSAPGPLRFAGSASWLSDDGIHPNARGHEYLARRVLEALRVPFGDAILKRPPMMEFAPVGNENRPF